MFEAHSACDVRRVLSLTDPEIEAVTTTGIRYHGHAEVLEYFHATEQGARIEVLAHHIEQDGDDVVAHGRIRVLEAGSVSDSPAAWRFRVRSGVVTSIAPLLVAGRLVA